MQNKYKLLVGRDTKSHALRRFHVIVQIHIVNQLPLGLNNAYASCVSSKSSSNKYCTKTQEPFRKGKVTKSSMSKYLLLKKKQKNNRAPITGNIR